jgi:hypothetical protein
MIYTAKSGINDLVNLNDRVLPLHRYNKTAEIKTRKRLTLSGQKA